jgi:hypothetical protein
LTESISTFSSELKEIALKQEFKGAAVSELQ